MGIYLLTFDQATMDEYAKEYFRQHPKARKVPLPHPYHPSINEWMIMKRPMMNALKQKWKDFIVWLVGQHGLSGAHIEQCEIEVRTYYYTDRRHDPDNSVPKFILDGLCESGFLVDDDNKHILSLTLKCFTDHDRPRTEIYIKTME